MRYRAAVAVLALALSLPGILGAAPRFDDQRLFTTPDERARLDELREQAHESGTGTANGAGERTGATRRPAVEQRKLPPVKLRGFVRRSDGPGAVWVNDGSTLGGGRLPEDVRVHSGRVTGNSVIVTLPDGRSIRLKPGQTWDPESGRVVDDYER